MPEPDAVVSADAAVIQASWGDGERFAALYDAYAAQLYRYAYRRVGPDHAEDVVAETFLAAFRRRQSYDITRADARPWLFGILTRQIADRRRAERARYRALARAGADEAVDGLADQVAADVSARAARRRLADALRRLPAADRDVLLLVAWGGLTHDEIATTLDIKVGTVRSRLHRARQRVRAALGGRNPAALTEENDERPE
ncbi:RNA polymerase sigma factor [Actinomycetes bacterium KLBMP 9797]